MVRYYVAGKGEVSKEEFDVVAAENRSKPWDGTFDGIFRDTTPILAYDDKK